MPLPPMGLISMGQLLKLTRKKAPYITPMALCSKAILKMIFSKDLEPKKRLNTHFKDNFLKASQLKENWDGTKATEPTAMKAPLTKMENSQVKVNTLESR